jgi:EmrB/QacA subfamily drug resistance transporter
MTMTNEESIKKYALLVATITSFLGPFMGSSVNMALPQIGGEFHMNAITLSWIASAYLLASAVFLLPFGKLADIIGRKKIYLTGMIVFTITNVLLALAPSAEIFIAFRALQGLGASMIFGTGIAIITSVYAPNERGKAIGITTAAVYLGLSMGPFLGGLMTTQLGWRGIFWVNSGLGLFSVYITYTKLKSEWADAKDDKFDYIGSFVYSIGLFLLIYGFSHLPDFDGALMIAGGIVFLVGFVIYEMRTEFPVFNLNLFRKNTVFAMSNMAALMNYSATFAITFLLSLYLQYIKGFKPQDAGLILIWQPVVMAIFSPVAGRLSDKIEPRIVSSIGMALTAVGLLMLYFLKNSTEIFYIIICLVIIGLGFALFSSPNMNAIMSSVEKRYLGIASGTLSTMRVVGQALSMGFVTIAFSVNIGKVKITPEYYSLFLDSMKYLFLAFSVVCFIGIFPSLARGKMKRER